MSSPIKISQVITEMDTFWSWVNRLPFLGYKILNIHIILLVSSLYCLTYFDCSKNNNQINVTAILTLISPIKLCWALLFSFISKCLPIGWHNKFSTALVIDVLPFFLQERRFRNIYTENNGRNDIHIYSSKLLEFSSKWQSNKLESQEATNFQIFMRTDYNAHFGLGVDKKGPSNGSFSQVTFSSSISPSATVASNMMGQWNW